MPAPLQHFEQRLTLFPHSLWIERTGRNLFGNTLSELHIFPVRLLIQGGQSILLEIRMKYILPLALLLATTLAACGGNAGSTQTSSNPGTGTWVESLSTTSGQPLGSFTFNMTQNNTTLTGGNMNFSNMGDLSQCFGAGTVMNGQMGPGMMNGGAMNMTMSWTSQGSTATNTLVMQGTMANGMSAGSGTFVLTGQTSGCTSQTGRFTMNPEPA